jgi:hypothetical protein
MSMFKLNCMPKAFSRAFIVDNGVLRENGATVAHRVIRFCSSDIIRAAVKWRNACSGRVLCGRATVSSCVLAPDRT